MTNRKVNVGADNWWKDVEKDIMKNKVEGCATANVRIKYILEQMSAQRTLDVNAQLKDSFLSTKLATNPLIFYSQYFNSIEQIKNLSDYKCTNANSSNNRNLIWVFQDLWFINNSSFYFEKPSIGVDILLIKSTWRNMKSLFNIYFIKAKDCSNLFLLKLENWRII